MEQDIIDILNNEEAIIEISDAVASEVEEQLLELESEEDEVLEEENNFDAIALPIQLFPDAGIPIRVKTIFVLSRYSNLKLLVSVLIISTE